MTITPNDPERQARELCWEAGLDPDVWVIVGHDDCGVIREQNWEAFEGEAHAVVALANLGTPDA